MMERKKYSDARKKTMPPYSRMLRWSFVIASGMTLVAMIGILFSPFYKSNILVTILLAIAAIGCAWLSIILKRVQ
jgi:uncharacterized membrane protein YqjE